jgi:hypothetical protein
MTINGEIWASGGEVLALSAQIPCLTIVDWGTYRVVIKKEAGILRQLLRFQVLINYREGT